MEQKKNTKSPLTYLTALLAPSTKPRTADVFEGFEGRIVFDEKNQTFDGIHTNNIVNCEIFVFYTKKTDHSPSRFSLVHRNAFTSSELIKQAHQWAGPTCEIFVIRHQTGEKSPALSPDAKSFIPEKSIKLITLPADKNTVILYFDKNGNLNRTFEHSQKKSRHILVTHHPHALSIYSGYMFHTALLPLYAHMETFKFRIADWEKTSDTYMKNHRPPMDQLLLFDKDFNQHKNFELIEPFKSMFNFIEEELQKLEPQSITFERIYDLINGKFQHELDEMKVDMRLFTQGSESVIDINIKQAASWFCYLTQRENLIKNSQDPMIVHYVNIARYYSGEKEIKLTPSIHSASSSLFSIPPNQPQKLRSTSSNIEKIRFLVILTIFSGALLHSLISRRENASYMSSGIKVTGLALLITLMYYVAKHSNEPEANPKLSTDDSPKSKIV